MSSIVEGTSELRRLDLPRYPKAFITAARLNKERDRVFVLMPFEAPHSDLLWRILHGVAEIHGLNMRRVDDRAEPAPIVSDILEEIERAEIIIADLTGLNPNVLYELGVAHVRCNSVILLCQERQALPFDLADIRCIFCDLHTHTGQLQLADRLTKTLIALRSVGPPTIITSSLERTKAIVNDLQTLGQLCDEELSKECVWFSGSLSAIAIDENEPFDPVEHDYHRTLLEEREALLSLAQCGCPVRCIITPPTSPLVVHRLDVMTHRLRCLLRFLESKDTALENVEFVVSPFRQKSLYIIGHISCLEGYKKGIQRGFGLNLRQTDLNAIRGSISLYEVLFNHLETYTRSLLEHGSRVEDRRTALRFATIACVRQSLELCQSLEKSQPAGLEAVQ